MIFGRPRLAASLPARPGSGSHGSEDTPNLGHPHRDSRGSRATVPTKTPYRQG
jgi:hypothetical protein